MAIAKDLFRRVTRAIRPVSGTPVRSVSRLSGALRPLSPDPG